MALRLTVATWDDRFLNIQVDSNELIENVKAILEAETGVPMNQQQLLFGGKALADGSTLQQNGVANEDVIELFPLQAEQNAAAQQNRQAPTPAALQLNPDGSAKAPAAFIQHVKSDPRLLESLRASNPGLAKAITDEDVVGFQEELRRQHRHRVEQAEALKREQELFEADPFDPETQRKIEEFIQQKNIEENLANALEYTPEVFGVVCMLYVDMQVNGVPVKAFVDSGAQTTIMTMDFAEKCFLTRLIDKRFAGMAVGVGSSKIIGKVHQAPLKVGNEFIPSSIIVLEQREGPQFIFGLDNLRRHQCILNLPENLLHIGTCNVQLPFLPEHEIPSDFKRHIEEVTEQEAQRNRSHTEQGGAKPGSSAVQDTAASAPVDVDMTPAPGSNPGSSNPAPAAAPAPARPAAAPSTADPNEEKVQRLMQLGFDRGTCVQALSATNGNEEAAASLLFADF